MAAEEEIFPNINTIHDIGETLSSARSSLIAVSLGNWSTRFAVRVVLTHGEQIALQTIPDKEVTKIPGGGQRPGESRENTIRRELVEEVGLVPGVLTPVGTIIEYRRQWSLLQISTCYWAEVPSLEQDAPPTEEGSQLLWARDGKETLAFLEASQGVPGNEYDREFAIARDMSLVKYYLEVFNPARKK